MNSPTKILKIPSIRTRKQITSEVIIYACFTLFFMSCKEKAKPHHLNRRIDNVKIDTVFDIDNKIREITPRINGKINGITSVFYPSGRVWMRKNFENDSVKGFTEEFYPNGQLQRFCYIVADKDNIFEKIYDSTGKLITQNGTPFLNCQVSESKQHDTFYLKAKLCNYGCAKLNVEIAPDGKNFKQFHLTKSDEPYTDSLNIWRPIRNSPGFSFFIKMTCTDSLGRQQVMFDTLSFQKNKPHGKKS